MLKTGVLIWKNTSKSYIISTMRGGKNRLGGFTIVELLIATAIFSTVLVIVISGFLQIGRLFYKGITVNNTQQVSRQILDSATNDVRFNNSVNRTFFDPDDQSQGFYCIGNARYTFNLHYIVTPTDNWQNGAKNFGLLRDTLYGATACSDPTDPLTPFNNPQELLSPNMQLNEFNVTPVGGGQVYIIVVDVVSGNINAVNVDAETKEASCQSTLKNSEFCSQSRLSTQISVNTGSLTTEDIRKNGVIVKKSGPGHGKVLSTVDSGGGPNILCGDTCSVVFPDITNITLTTDITDTFSKFKNWKLSKGAVCSNGNSSTSCKLRVVGGIDVTAVFECKNPSGSCSYNLNVTKGGDGTGWIDSDKTSGNPAKPLIDCHSDCSETFDVVTDIKLTVHEDANSTFDQWKGVSCKGPGETKSSKTCTVHVDKPITAQPKFKCNSAACTFDITVANNGGKGGGTVQSTPDPTTNARKIDCGNTCNASFPSAGSTISLTAIADDTSVFNSWSGDCTKNVSNKSANPLSVTVSDSIDCTARFDRK